MLISRVWLAELLQGAKGVAAAALDDGALTRHLTGLGLEVEATTSVGGGLEAVVVAEVAQVQPHPQAERLQVVEVFDGQARRQVVCGASNVPAVGGKVVLAPPGVTLPHGVQLAAREVRGVQSEGMLCSEAELDIGSEDDGIVVLGDDARAGQGLIDLVPGVVDTIIELSVTPNRPDALGHVGVARDLAVALGGALPVVALALPEGPLAPELARIDAPDRCGRYFGVAFADVQVGPSPLWMRVRLHRLGLRALSNVVDITNLVMLQWGQPLHGFDRAQLVGGSVRVREARPGEPLRLLDGRELELAPGDLVIADAERAVALAGIMGADASGVGSETRDVLLEAAWFEPTGVRRSARRYGLNTDSSHRFERGVDPGVGLVGACAQAAAWLQEFAGGRCVGLCEVGGRTPPRRVIHLRPARVTALLGAEIPSADARRMLDGLGVTVDLTDPARWRCTAPTHRPDLADEVDLVDELLRHWGFDRLPQPRMDDSGVGGAPREATADGRVVARVTDALCERGFHEHIGLVFCSSDAVALTAEPNGQPEPVRLRNPMGADGGLLRTHLLPGLLQALARNVARHGRAVGLFECGRVYWQGQTGPRPAPSASGRDPEPVEERLRAAVLCSDPVHPEAGQVGHGDPRRAGGALVHALTRLGHPAKLQAPTSAVSWLYPGIQAEVVLVDSGAVVGRFGRVHRQVLRHVGLPVELACAYGELWLDQLPPPRVPLFRVLPRYPATSRDVSLDVGVAGPTAAEIVEAILQAENALPALADPPRLQPGDRGGPAVEILDDYRGQGVTPGRRALLLRLHYRAVGRSVTDGEVQERHLAIVTRACDQLRQRDPGLAVR